MATNKSIPSNTTLISELRANFDGQFIAPDDARYDQARAVFYGGIDHRPAVIIKVRNADEVPRVISMARDMDMELAVRSGGHSVAGHCTTEGGIVLDLSNLKDLKINTQEQTAWAEPGLTAIEYTKATHAHGLATGFGDTGSVGIGGITLGGGIGYLVRKHGLTIDDLLAADIVTADGQLLRVDSELHPDLFWAIRGGGGNFGVATRFKFRLHDVNSVYGGMLILPAAPDTIASFISEAESAPEELSTIANVMTAPPMPFLPKEVHGKLIIFAMLVYVGDVNVGERVIASFRKLATPYADMIKPMRYPEIYPPDDSSYHPIAASRTMFIDSVDRRTAETIMDHIKASTGMMAVTQLRVLGGAMVRVPVEATAFAHRNSRIMANLVTLYGNPEERSTHEDWATKFQSKLRQSDRGTYVNFLGDEGEASVRAAYPGATWDRLKDVKRRYDPTNLFRRNQNISPL